MHESTSDTDEDFFDALALLHSTEQDSAEKLRRMLDACIERKHGHEKTLVVRMSNAAQNASALPMHTSKRHDHVTQGGNAIKTEIRTGDPETISLLEANEAENIKTHRTPGVKVFEIDYEDCCEDEEDIPRISIPDEGSADGTAVCKICNGAKLGPLILLECQECQEAYHPLCHQPPVIDVDVYDPRFVWRCGRCVVGAPSVTSTRVKIMEKRPVRKVRRNSDTVKENANISGLRIPGKRDGDLFGKNDLSIEDRSTTQLCDSSLFAKDLANISQRNRSLPLSTYSRKRIGSKLSVTRISSIK
ncbi:PREDICTED: integrator complex subunit 12-like isoform X2 [Wasmannia auropunctata]|uniref:integrator complex subunit 12-like isoform X2 n=1 Tax=Wasmannia auropunctata TaxID=64793 RepID=UPI0005ED72DC|nr:PREDICTED: integrator complex subunit 12-like isoform X2 [Wasmannia auropunctata]XP_011698317.1 PREDICTED: integrator complex subunit 12-like isoform X2 [Wasmannia auropunctata]